jgi:polyribonucleotide nucleotidyltransferase
LKVRIERQIGASTLSIETGELAKQAAGSCLVQYGETVVLSATASGAPRPGDFFPLTCDYRERVAAAGKFPGGFLKREGRPTTKETLTARLMDRPIRPLFPEWYMDEVQVMSTVLASDRQNDPDVLAMNGASAALCISSLPFQGPIGSIRLGYIDGEIIPFPTTDELVTSELDLIVSGNKESILMIEGFAAEMPEDKMADCILAAHQFIRQICEMQEELVAKAGKPKTEYPTPEPDALFDRLKERCYDALSAVKQTEGKQARADACDALKKQIIAEMIPDPAAEGAITPEAFKASWSALEQRVVRDSILAGRRSDGRDYSKLRPISCQVDLLPRVHGSALFQRGETQSLATVTLGTGRDEQRVDGLLEEYTQKFMLHYYFPPYSVGECRPIRGPGRREIGHGALAERSIKPVLPAPDGFPYTIRIISDILESNGSSSMATVCAATLALMSAGVPISNPVAGISIGLVKEGDRYVLLTDILGEEDHYGDMDFKISGTQNGITGIQLDLKIKGIDEEIVKNTLVQAREARIEILRTMLTVINRPRQEISHWAPRLLRTRIDPEKIGLLIGPGGKMIRSIQEATGAVIEVEDDGTVTVACNKMEGAKEAMAKIEALTASVEIGKIYDGRVTSIKDFGAFIEILPGKDGLCHISELADEYVNSVTDVCKVGDPMQVKVIAIDDQDRVKLSRRAVLREQNPNKENGGGGGGGGGGRGRGQDRR